ncbi:MAG: hypothetical protein ABSE97_07670 [Verrucomicrobiota bacterium]|jgi:hypothetical protein
MPTAVVIWVWFCAYLNCAGWALSAIHELNAGGYAVALLIWFIALCVWRKRTSAQILPHVRWRKFRRRFRRPFPLAFLILAGLAILGGVLYAPTNYDALAYRTPRVLHWLAAGQWHWIHTVFPRINTRSCGIEWVSAPVIALLRTDRWLFLINFISFLLLPGLVFSVFTRLGVRRRVAWYWMWIVPTGYGFLLQAGSIGNDLFGATFALAAVDFALRANRSRLPRDFFASLLAAAVMTSVKMNNLPLLLPWAVAILPSLGWMMRRRTLMVLAVGAWALLASALPTMVMNFKYCGDWSGLVLETSGLRNDPVFQAGANTVLLAIENFVPPVFPLAGQWNQFADRVMPAGLGERLQQTILWPDSKLRLPEMQMEESSGLGFGVCALLLASMVAAMFAGRNHPGDTRQRNRGLMWQTCVRLAPIVSLVALLSQSHMGVTSRLVIAYYAFLLPPVLVCAGHEWVVTRRWWKISAFAVFIMAAGLLVLSPARSLFPALTLVEKLQARQPDSRLLARMREVYSVYRGRDDGFAPARAVLPPGLKVLGVVTFDDPETSLWRPFGSRRIEHVCPQDTPADLKQGGVEYILVREELLAPWFKCSLDDWLKQMNARVVQKIPLNLRASRGALDWYLVQLQ